MRVRHVLPALAVLAVLAFGSAEAVEILIDNDAGAPEVVYTGTWNVSTYSPDRIGPNYQHSNKVSGLTATYTPDIPAAGEYLVEAFWNASSDRGSDVPYTINYSGGSHTEYRDQRTNGNQWNDLGTYAFDAGTGGNVVISSTVSNNTYVIADAIRFTSVGPALPTIETLEPVADAYVQGNGSSSGSGTVLLAKSDGGNIDWSRKTYMRFDLSGISFDPTTDLGAARLALDFVNSGVGSTAPDTVYDFAVFGLLDGHAGEAWGEGSIVWSNAPGNDTTSHWDMLVPAEASFLGGFSVTGTSLGTVEFASAELDAFISANTADDLVTFMVTRITPQNGTGGVGDSYAHGIGSRESGSAPQLILEPAEVLVPEPATCALLALGALALRRRRRA